MSEGSGAAAFDVPGYRIRRRIGRGGFAVVYEAEQLSLGRAVALKMLEVEQATDRDLHRFERERLLLSDLSRHRHVVDVIDAGTTAEGCPFIVMRLYRRGSLAQVLADSGPLRPTDVVTLIGKLAGALQAAHSLGVIHRDVKPENVLISDDGEPALADFGISILGGPDRTTTGNFFSMGHVAPEVLQRAEYGVASDVYALASTAYQVLSGRLAFRGGNQFAQMRAIVEDPVPPIGRPDVPPALEAVVLTGMAKEPRDRYPSAVAFADALASAWRQSQAIGPLNHHLGPAATIPGPSAPPAGAHPAYPPPTAVPTRNAVPTPIVGPTPAGAPSLTQALPEPASAPTGEGGRRRGRGVLAAGAALAIGVPAVLGGTYALGVPPGSVLHSRAAAAPARTVVIATDMSLQGLPAGEDNPTNSAVELYLASIGHRAGAFAVALHPHDIATPRWIRWDAATCRAVAAQHLAEADEVAVIGPYNSGCAKLMVPILNDGDGGPMAMISHGATDPGLTRSWDAGEPDRYYPSGRRNFARVVTTDDVQGKAAATFAHGDLKVTKVFVLDDGQVYGRHVARAFVDAAKASGLQIVGEARWSRGSTDYRGLFAAAKAAGADAVFLGGAVANNGLRLVKDKVAVLGDNDTVKLLSADGFTGDPKLTVLPEAQGMYLTFPGLSPEAVRRRGGAGSRFLDQYQARYGKEPGDPYALYAVAAAQVVLAAVRDSDGTRAGVMSALFSGEGITVPKAESVLGRDTRIDPATGDVSIKDVTIEIIKRSEETYETVVTES